LNIGSGQETMINALVNAIEAATGQAVNRVWNQEKSGGVRRLVADISQARELLGFRPKISLAEGLQKMLVEDGRFQAGERVMAGTGV
jgi:nucleoside-diphosphate-sugar epimerase